MTDQTPAKAKVLVPIDGSDNSNRAAAYALDLVRRGFAAELHFVNVQPPVGGVVSTFVGSKAVEGYHHDEGVKSLAEAKRLAEAAGIPVELHILVGSPPGKAICELSEELGCSQIVMGSHGYGRALSVVLGSVVNDVLRRVSVPVTVVQ
jgi:nucleotide-binding universal stress UspA family protein